MNRRSGVVRAAFSAALFGAATPVAKILLGDVPPQVLAGLFYVGAAVCLLPAFARSAARGAGLALPRDTRNRRYLAGAILFGGVLGPVLLLLGLRLAQAAPVALLLNLETTATAVVGVLIFREHLGRWARVGNVGVLAAGVMLGLEGGTPGLLGGLLVAGAALCWGIDNNLTALIDGITPIASTFWKGACAGLVNLAIGLALTPVKPSLAWGAALLVGGLSYGVSIVLYISAAQMLGATRSQMIFATSPFFGVLLAVVWLGESMSGAQVAASALMVASLAVLMLDQHGHPHMHEDAVHTHSHRHDDGHHDHVHEGLPPGHRHTHEHAHERMEHEHAHWPDLHHRHDHWLRSGR